VTLSRDEVLNIILATKVIAVIRMSDTEKLIRVVEAIKRGGVRAIEITMTTPSALEIIAAMAKRKTAGTLIGAGTVLDAATAEAVIRAGAEFVVSPITNFDMIAACKRNDTFVAPGALSPTEIVVAEVLPGPQRSAPAGPSDAHRGREHRERPGVHPQRCVLCRHRNGSP
jgi:2-dehydro-3-deoxyphosphogluconate aldolase/(4S)-4-hydroxy-2-oxoglutarate aldolase